MRRYPRSSLGPQLRAFKDTFSGFALLRKHFSASAIEAGTAETVEQGSVHESAVAKPDAHTPGENPHG